MGSNIEVNDTLNLTKEQGFPSAVLDRVKHMKTPITAESVKDVIFKFCKEDARLFHLDPVRVFLVENIDGKWLIWGHALIQSQEVRKVNPGADWKAGQWETSGTFVIDKIYDPEFQKFATTNQCPPGKSFF